jgi:hypothetical protein
LDIFHLRELLIDVVRIFSKLGAIPIEIALRGLFEDLGKRILNQRAWMPRDPLILGQVIFHNIQVAMSIVGNEPTETPPWYLKDLGQRIHAEQGHCCSEVTKRVEDLPREHQAVVYLVTDERDFEFLCYLQDFQLMLLAPHHTARIGRINYQDGFGFVVD